MIEPIEANSDHGNFLAAVLAGQASRWSWAPGIDFTFNEERVGWGVALNIKRQFQRPDLFASALAKRFQEAMSYEGYYLCLDSWETFIVWHAIQEEGRDLTSLQRIINRLLDLAGLHH
jgi:hypothetical protein